MAWAGARLRRNPVPVALAALGLASVPAAAAARFDPPLDRPLRLVTSEVRKTQTGTEEFAIERDLVFAREGGGYRATMTARPLRTAASTAGKMFTAAVAPFVGEPIVIHLDAAGAITAIDGEEQLWDRLCAALEGMATGKGATGQRRDNNARALASPLRRFPPDRRRATLGSAVTAIIAGPLADRLPGERPTTIAGRTFAGAPVTLAARETVTRSGDTIDIVTRAEGDQPQADGGREPVHSVVERRERVDAVRGLVLETRYRLMLSIGQPPQGAASDNVTTTRLIF